jgi:hypothetical protein
MKRAGGGADAVAGQPRAEKNYAARAVGERSN